MLSIHSSGDRVIHGSPACSALLACGFKAVNCLLCMTGAVRHERVLGKCVMRAPRPAVKNSFSSVVLNLHLKNEKE